MYDQTPSVKKIYQDFKTNCIPRGTLSLRIFPSLQLFSASRWFTLTMGFGGHEIRSIANDLAKF